MGTPRTLLPLSRFAELVGYSPILFNQVTIPELQDASSCSDPVLQYTWQPRTGGRISRTELAYAIRQAEQAIERECHFSPLPTWRVDDVTDVWSNRAGWWRMGARAPVGYFISGGQEAWSLIAASAAVNYSDLDGDGYKETATVTQGTSVTDPNEISVYYPVGGSVENAHDPEWEVRPIQVSISGGVATITFKRHQAVKSDLLEALDAQGVNGLDDANFLSAVSVWRHYNDPSVMGVAEWFPSICDTSGCQVSAQTVCMQPVDERSGLLSLQAAEWDSDASVWRHTCPCWWQRPFRVRLNYRAGFRDRKLARPLVEMGRELERAVAFLGLSYLDREILACEQLRNMQAHWRVDLAMRESTPAGGVGYAISPKLLDNPFGTTRAAVYAWRVVQPLLIGQAVLA